MNKKDLERLIPYFGGLEGAFQETICEIVERMESVRIQAVRVGEGLYYGSPALKRDVHEIKREADDLLSLVLALRYRITVLDALICIDENDIRERRNE